MLVLSSTPALAILVGFFVGADKFIEQASDIVVVKCIGIPDGGRTQHEDGFYPVNVEVLKALKGNKHLGKQKAATIYSMEIGKLYLFTSSGGSAYGTDLLAVAELSAVPLPSASSLKELDGKSLREQVVQIFNWRREELVQKLRSLEGEKKVLDRAVP